MYKCAVCGKQPNQIGEYINLAEELGCTPDEAVEREEGTFSRVFGLFYCTNCYVNIGCPLHKAEPY